MSYEDPWAEAEALETERFEADFTQAAMEATAGALTRARKAGRCTHGSTVGYRKPAAYPEQEGLKPGQSRCTAGCKAVFGSDQEWAAAIDAATEGA
jgi:hypothetical protein